MLGGYLEFFMKPDLAGTYTRLKRELEELVQKKVHILSCLSPHLMAGLPPSPLPSLSLSVN